MRCALSLALCLTPLLACDGAPPQEPSTTPIAEPTATMADAPPAPPPAPSVAALPEEGKPCGELSCRQFPSVEAAMAVVLKTDPAVLAVGEAHAQKGTEGIASSTKRFTDTILPMLKGKATDIVLELTVGQDKCKKAVEETEKTTKKVTKNQAAGNQNEFLTLGNEAKALEIRPHVLRPECKDFDRVARAKAVEDKVVEMLTLIARHSESLLRRILERNAKEDRKDKVVLAYGGALHNDVSPAAGKEAWSFGPSLAKATENRFVELDIYVPEYIKDTPSWKAMPWHAHYDRAATPDDAVTLYQTGERSFVLIFAPTRDVAPEDDDEAQPSAK